MTETFIKIFDTYGWPGLIGVVGIIIMTYFLNTNQKKSDKKMEDGFDKLAEAMMTQNNKLVDVLSTSISTSNQETQKQLFNIINTTLCTHDDDKKNAHDEAFSYRMDVSNEINDYIKEINDTYRANRTLLLEFHNSKENLNGLPFAWYDISFERQSRDTMALQSKGKNIQIQNIVFIINDINHAPNNIVHYSANDMEHIYEKSSVLYAQLKEIDAKDLIFSGLYNKNNKLIGILCIEYNDRHPYIEQNIDYNDINLRSEQLSTLLRFKS